MDLNVMQRRHFTALGLAVLAWGQGARANTSPAASATKAKRTVLVVGDSLSAEYGLKRGTGWVALLATRLDAEKMNATVVNASISGDTTSGGRSRLASLLKLHKPSVVVIELGGNDALRGLPVAMTRSNLSEMTKMASQAGAKVLLLGMQMPPNYGAEFGKQFEAVFTDVAKAQKVALVPFFLAGVADGPDPLKLFQADRIHPVEAAHPQMLANVWPALAKLLK